MCRLLNTISIFHPQSSGLVDAKKAFSCVELPYLFYTLARFELREQTKSVGLNYFIIILSLQHSTLG